jgi:plastocyanin
VSSNASRVRSTLAALLVLAGLGGSAGLASATESLSAVVEIEADRFEPDRIEIEAGATVEWRNVATVARSVSADDGSFDSGRLRPGQSFVVSFAEPGEYPYLGAVGGRTPGTPVGVVVVHPSGTIGEEAQPPGEDPPPADDRLDGVDAEDPADLEAPPPSEEASPPAALPPWEEGSDASGTEAGPLPAPPAAPVAEPVSAGGSAAAVGQAQEGVIIVDNAYQPKQIEVDPGTTVVWTQEGELPHTVTADDGSFDSGEMGQGDTYSQSFEQAGSYPYYCTFHGAPGGEGMSGTVVVTGPPGGPGAGADTPGAPGEGEDGTGTTLADTGTSVVTLFLVTLALLVAGISLLLAARPRPSLGPVLTGFENLRPAPLGRGSA